jgi:hypothetical protein
MVLGVVLDKPCRMGEVVKGQERLHIMLPKIIDDFLVMSDRLDVPFSLFGLNPAPFERETISVHSQVFE